MSSKRKRIDRLWRLFKIFFRITSRYIFDWLVSSSSGMGWSCRSCFRSVARSIMSSRRRMARILNKTKRRYGNRFRVRAFKKKKKGRKNSFHGLDDLIGASDRPRGKKALDSMIRLKVFVAEDRSKIYFLYIAQPVFFRGFDARIAWDFLYSGIFNYRSVNVKCLSNISNINCRFVISLSRYRYFHYDSLAFKLNVA